MDEPATNLQSAGSLLSTYRIPIKKGKPTERGELLQYFSQKLDRTIPRVATYLKGVQDLPTLYYIKSSCDQAEARGVPWGAAFHTSLKVK